MIEIVKIAYANPVFTFLFLGVIGTTLVGIAEGIGDGFRKDKD